jgi:hypothetical protein
MTTEKKGLPPAFAEAQDVRLGEDLDPAERDELLAELVRTEAESAEATRDEPYDEEALARVRRAPKGGTVLSVRLNDDELAALTALARDKHIPVSTMARSLILTAMNPRPNVVLDANVLAAIRVALRDTLESSLQSASFDVIDEDRRRTRVEHLKFQGTPAAERPEASVA